MTVGYDIKRSLRICVVQLADSIFQFRAGEQSGIMAVYSRPHELVD